MPLDPMIGLGCKFYVHSSEGSTSKTQVKGLTSLDGPGPSGARVDTSVLDSTSNYEDSQGGLVNPGEIQAVFAYDSQDAGQQLMAGRLQTRALTSFTIEHPSTAQPDETVIGFVNAGGRAVAKGSMTTRPFTVVVSGAPGWPVTTT